MSISISVQNINRALAIECDSFSTVKVLTANCFGTENEAFEVSLFIHGSDHATHARTIAQAINDAMPKRPVAEGREDGATGDGAEATIEPPDPEDAAPCDPLRGQRMDSADVGEDVESVF